MVNNSGLSQIKKNTNKATYTECLILKVENIPKPLTNMNIQFIYNITVEHLN